MVLRTQTNSDLLCSTLDFCLHVVSSYVSIKIHVLNEVQLNTMWISVIKATMFVDYSTFILQGLFYWSQQHIIVSWHVFIISLLYVMFVFLIMPTFPPQPNYFLQFNKTVQLLAV